MEKFEMVEILKPDMSQSDIELELNTQRNTFGNMKYANIEHWGIRKMAYKIKGYECGYYILIKFNSETRNNEIKYMEKALAKNDNVVKFVIVNMSE